uniref:Luciferin 4-monooxygenase n=2 Tax=Lygus hesperus TaxID=30085 RepID=A0A0K8SSC0_LYGHE
MNLARSRVWRVLAQDCRLARRPMRVSARRPLSASVETNIVKSPFRDVTLPTCTVPELIWEHLDRWADKTAVECGITGKSYTYAELKLLSRRLAFALLKSGLRPGDVVTVVMPNIPEYPVAILGIMEAGMVVTGINPIYSSEEILFQLKDSGSNVVIVHPDQLANLLQAKEKLGSSIRVICVHDYDGRHRSLPPGVIAFSDFIDGESGGDDADLGRLLGVRQDVDSTALLPYSSGTTGLPKGVCLSHKNLTANVSQASYPDINPIEFATKNYQDTVPTILPLFHIYGASVVMMRSLVRGAKLVTLPKFDPKPFLKILETNDNIVLYVVPPIILFLSSHPTVSSLHLERLKLSMTGGAPCSAADIDRLRERKPHPIIQGYGMTESSPLLTQGTLNSTKYASIGKLVSNTEAKILDITTGNSLPMNENGELCFRGPQIMKCYHNRPEATAETVDADGWLRTGDVGYFDEEGDFFVVDRIKELIKVKGFQVAPAELEGLLREHPEVSDAAVTALPCSRSGEVPIAFVIPKPAAAESLKEVALQQYVAEKVAPYKQISKIVFVESIPKSATGKILRRQLKEIAQKEYC